MKLRDKGVPKCNLETKRQTAPLKWSATFMGHRYIMGMTSIEGTIFLVGATGVGKSALAMELARAMGGAILAMDAMQVYRGADIGTSKPTLAERTEIPHGGLNLVDFGSSFDVAQYLRHADLFLREQREAGRRVVIVGGTGLYFRALTRGLCEAPQGPEELRTALSELSVEDLRERLEKVDPGMLEEIDGANPRRLVRAIEVMESTGRSLRAWQNETPEPLVTGFTAYWICREKEELAKRIESRVETMFATGWVEEVRGLVEAHGGAAVRGFAGIGYREIALMEEEKISHGGLRRAEEEGGGAEIAASAFPSKTWERGKLRESGNGSGPRLPLQEERRVKSDILVATRQYVKRQLTWFAREPNLQRVMLTGTQPISAVLPSLL